MISRSPDFRDLDVRPLKVAEISPELENVWHGIRSSFYGYASPYYDLEFVRAVSRCRKDVEVAVIYNLNAEVIGFFPFQRMSRKQGIPVGGRLNDLHGIMSINGIELPFDQIVSKCGLNSFAFHSMPLDTLSQTQYSFRSMQSHHIDLTQGWDDYSKWIKKHSSTVKRQPQKTRALEKLGDVEFEFDCVDSSALETLIDLKRAKYQRTKTFDILSVDWASELLKEIHSTSRGDFQGVLSAIWLDDRMIAGHFGMISDDVLHYWFPTFDAAFSKYSPGTELILRVAETAAAMGIKMVDFGFGDDPFKFKFCNGSHNVCCGQIQPKQFAFLLAKQRYQIRNKLKQIPMKPLAKSILRGVFPDFGQWNFK